MKIKTAYRITFGFCGCLPNSVQWCFGQKDLLETLRNEDIENCERVDTLKDILKYGGVYSEYSITNLSVERFDLPSEYFGEIKTCKNIEGVLIQRDFELQELIEQYHTHILKAQICPEDITGAIINDTEIWVTNESRYYRNDAIYERISNEQKTIHI